MGNLSESTKCHECKKSSKYFKRLSPSELEFINQNKTQLLYRKGETICKQGAFASDVLYISDGLVSSYLESSNNRHINLKILKTSEFIGLSSIYGDNIYNYSTAAIKDSTICMIKKESFRKVLTGNGDFASEIIKGYCENENQLFNEILSLGSKQMHGRLADTLIYLYNQNLQEEKIFSYLSRKDIAEFAGLSTESTVRLLTEFKNDSIIDIIGKETKLLNPDLLKEISRQG